MPELPEVEVMTRNVRRWTDGRVVRALTIDDPKVVRSGDELVGGLSDEPVTAVFRRAKHMVIATETTELAAHFRMTGKVVRNPSSGRIRWRLVLDDGSEVAFVDSRRLGELRVLAPGGAAEWLGSLGLGPDVFPDRFDAAWWADRFAGKRGPIKPALLDQARVAGIGNILASELLWRSGIHPAVSVPALDESDWQRISDAIVPLIEEIVAEESGEEIVYVNEAGGAAPSAFAVYGNEGEPCVRCGAPVARMKQAGRSTFWCGACQPERERR